MDWTELIAILRARWRTAAAAFVVATGLLSASILLSPPLYEVEGALVCRAGEAPRIGVGAADLRSASLEELVRELLPSPAFRRRVAEAVGSSDPGGGARGDPLEAVRVEGSKDGRRAGLVWRGSDPERGCATVAAIQGLVAEEARSRFEAAVEAARHAVERALAETDVTLREARTGRDAMREKVGLPPARETHEEALRAADEEIAALEGRLRDADERRGEIRARLEAIEAASRGSVTDPGALARLAAEVRGGPLEKLVSRLLGDTMELEMRFMRESRHKTPIHPDVANLRAEIDENRRILQELLDPDGDLGGLLGGIEQTLKLTRDRERHALEAERQGLGSLADRCRALLEGARRARERLLAVGDAYEAIDARIAIAQGERKRLRTERQQLALYLRANREASARIFPPGDPRRVPAGPLAGSPILVGLLGLVAAAGASWAHQAVDPRACSPAALRRATGAPFVASVPARPEGPAPAEAALARAAEVLLASRTGPTVLALVPTHRGAAVASLARRLAEVAGRRGEAALVVGCGPRTIPGWPGLAEIAGGALGDRLAVGAIASRAGTGRVPVEAALTDRPGGVEAVVLQSMRGMHVVPAGEWPEEGPVSWSAGAFAAFVRWARRQYPLTLLVCAPLSESPQALAAAGATDGALVVGRGHAARVAAIAALRGSLEKIGCPVAGGIWLDGRRPGRGGRPGERGAA